MFNMCNTSLFTDDSVDCRYSTSDTKPVHYEVILVTGISLSVLLLIMIGLLFTLHCRHGKRVRHTMSLEQLHNGDDGNLSDQSYVDPTEEVNPTGKQSLAYVESQRMKKSTIATDSNDKRNSSMVW